jgi:vacuolar-type H+-ATPase subunit F/Vma7
MKPAVDSQLAGARLVVLGTAGLVEGFSLIGAETHPDADQAKVEEVLAQLVKDGSDALVLLESHLAHAGGTWLNRLRNEGGRIVVTELPPLSAPENYAPAVDDVVHAVLGPEALK